MREYKLDLLGLCETRWHGSREFTTTSGELLIYSGHTEEEKHEHGVGLILTLSLPTTTIVAPPLNVIKWQMAFNSAA
jgi:hypothetical protein